MPNWRTVTNTEGVDLKALTYEEMCAHDGVMQTTAKWMDGYGFGLGADDDDPLLPNAAILRSAEAADAILNAARSGQAETNRRAGGYILCSIVQMGGLIYVSFLLIITIVLLNCLPCINLIFQLLFDSIVACASGAGEDGKPKRKSILAKARSVARAGAGAAAAAAQTSGGPPRQPGEAAPTACKGNANGELANLWAGQLGAINPAGREPGFGGPPKGRATGGKAPGEATLDDEQLTPAQLRAVLKKRRGNRLTDTLGSASESASLFV